MLFNTVLFTGNANPVLAQEIASHLGVELGKAMVGRFSDGEVTVEIRQNVRARDVFVVQPTCTPTNENLMELLIMVDALKRASARRITAVIPYFGYARQDRRPRSTRVPISAKVVANLLETVGVERVLTMDLHADQIQGFFDIPVDNIYASPVLLSDLKSKDYPNLVVISPDVGGVVRARALAKQLDCDLAIIDKRRPTANVSEVMHVIGEIDGRNCVIMDDMIDTAGTLVKAAEVLKERGARSVYAYCTHPVFSGPAIERLMASQIDEVVITNTIPLSDAGQGLHQDPAAVGGLPVCRDHAPHQRRRVGDQPLRGAEQQLLIDEAGFLRSPSLFLSQAFGLQSPKAAWSRAPQLFGVNHEIHSLRAYAAGDRSEPPPAQRSQGAGHRLRRRRAEDDRARPQRAVLRAEEGSLPLVDPRDGRSAARPRRCCCATTRCTPTSPSSCTSTSSASTRRPSCARRCRCTSPARELSPAVKTDKCLVSHVRTDLEIECLAAQLPEFVTIDLSGLVKGTSLHASDLKLPAGIKAVKRGTLDPVIVAVTLPKVEEEVVAAPTVVVPAEKGKAKPKKDEKQNKK